ncbi:hypothetical protein FDECE_3905 [Fusarium decemcellulare]|nr:hypothetical protein FDECE_3905 [Fusarium decemcellulare]
MQFSILALTLAATGALALPGREKPQKPEKPQPGNVQTISCSSGSPYCCNQEFDAKKGKSYYKCSEFVNNCNAVAVCCNNNGPGSSQKCSGMGDTTIVVVEGH